MRWTLLASLIAACTPAPVAELKLSAEAIDFGAVAQCRRRTQTLELSNVGAAPLTLDVPAVEDFELSPTGEVRIAPGETKSLNVVFVAPQREGEFARTLVLAEKSVQLRAVTTSENWEWLSLNFGGVSTRGTDERTFTISEPATLEPLDEPAFSVTQHGNEVVVSFTPTETRAYAATLNMRRENAACVLPTDLRGSGVSAALEWTPGLLSPATTVGAAANLSVEFTNLRTRIVRMTNVSVVEQGMSGPSPHFSAPTTFDVPEATFDATGELVAGRAVLEFTFTPTQAGTLLATLRATTDVPEQPHLAVTVRTTTSQ